MSPKSVLNAFRFALRISMAATLSFYLASLLKLEHPTYAIAASILATDTSLSETRRQGTPGLFASVLGVFIGVFARSLFEPHVLLIGVAIGVAIVLCHITPASSSARMGALGCAIVVTAYDWHWWQTFLRLSEIVLGIASTWLLSRLVAATGSWFACATPKQNVIPFKTHASPMRPIAWTRPKSQQSR